MGLPNPKPNTETQWGNLTRNLTQKPNGVTASNQSFPPCGIQLSTSYLSIPVSIVNSIKMFIYTIYFIYYFNNETLNLCMIESFILILKSLLTMLVPSAKKTEKNYAPNYVQNIPNPNRIHSPNYALTCFSAQMTVSDVEYLSNVMIQGGLQHLKLLSLSSS